MAITTKIKDILNSLLSSVNVKLDTLTAEKSERERIERQARLGQFDGFAFPLLDGMESFDGKRFVRLYADHKESIDRLLGGKTFVKFDRINSFFESPDVEVLYMMVRDLKPTRILEIGSGNSTRIISQAIRDGDLKVNHIAIDPEPRADISGLTTQTILKRFEETDFSQETQALQAGDLLFIDSSHMVHVANDVVKLFCLVIPMLQRGVVVHVHDIFLPFDYPEPFCFRYPHWGEQYLLQVMLTARPREIIWPGYFVQQSRKDLYDELPFLRTGRAQSFWFRV